MYSFCTLIISISYCAYTVLKKCEFLEALICNRTDTNNFADFCALLSLLNWCPFPVQTMQPFIGEKRGSAGERAQNYHYIPLCVYQPIETRGWGGGMLVWECYILKENKIGKKENSFEYIYLFIYLSIVPGLRCVHGFFLNWESLRIFSLHHRSRRGQLNRNGQSARWARSAPFCS